MSDTTPKRQRLTGVDKTTTEHFGPIMRGPCTPVNLSRLSAHTPPQCRHRASCDAHSGMAGRDLRACEMYEDVAQVVARQRGALNAVRSANGVAKRAKTAQQIAGDWHFANQIRELDSAAGSLGDPVDLGVMTDEFDVA